MLHLGRVDEKGHANIHPVAYYYVPTNNKFYVLTEKESKSVISRRMRPFISVSMILILLTKAHEEGVT
jgi:general stress protein 26